MKQPIRFGIIGMGAQGTVYARILAQTEGVTCPYYTLGALSSRDLAKKEQFAALYPHVPFFTDWREMLSSGTVDAVVIATPHKSHPEIATYCIAQGMPTVLDKPSGIYSGSVVPMNQCAEAHPQVPFGMMFNMRTNTIYQRVRQVVQSGELGDLRRVQWTATNSWRADSYYAQADWRGTWGGEGGGLLINQAPHQLDLWQWICGMPQKLYANVQFGRFRNIDVENEATIVVEYPNGGTGVFTTCAHDILGVDRLEISLDGGKIVVEDGGKSGTIYRLRQTEQEINAAMPLDEMMRVVQGATLDGLYTTEELTNSTPWGQQRALILENFALHMLEGMTLLVPGVEGINSLRLANASLLSAWTGQEIHFPMDDTAFLTHLNQKVAEEGKFDAYT